MSANKANSRVASFMNRLRSDVGGNALAMMAAAMIPLAGMIGGGLDMSRVYMARAKLQNACDAGALAARQGMTGTSFTSNDTYTANKYFNFNFPTGTMDARNVQFSIAQNGADRAALIGSATAEIPTSLMKIFAFEKVDISVDCNVKRDLGNNDVMVVLDVTGSMRCDPGVAFSSGDCDGGANSKIARLRTGSLGLFRALQDGGNARTRFGLMPYSSTVNVGRNLRTRDILRTTNYQNCIGYGDYYYPTSCTAAFPTGVHINGTEWFDDGGSVGQRIAAWRQSGNGCIEERPTIGNAANPIQTTTSISQDDIDLIAQNDSDTRRQWGRYDPFPRDMWGNNLVNRAHDQAACPSEAQRLRAYNSETAFQTAINSATANVTGGTYHDIGIVWGARWLSPTGMFAGLNPEEFNGFPVNKHIVFMTDGTLDTGPYLYSAYGIALHETRMTGPGTQSENHRARFLSACSRARSMNMTIWVIALDVGDTDDIKPCATSIDHFYTSDGSDLEAVFTQIGQGIGDLRLTL